MLYYAFILVANYRLSVDPTASYIKILKDIKNEY